jgi:zinc protease
MAPTDVVGEHARLYRPDNAIVVLAGDVEPQSAFAMAERAFGDWRRPAGTAPAPAASDPTPPGVVLAIDLPGSEQATVVLAAPSVGRGDPSYGAAEVANALLGGTVSSRLGAEIRVRRGLAYDA